MPFTVWYSLEVSKKHLSVVSSCPWLSVWFTFLRHPFSSPPDIFQIQSGCQNKLKSLPQHSPLHMKMHRCPNYACKCRSKRKMWFFFFYWMTALTVLTTFKQYSQPSGNICLGTFFKLSALITKTKWSSFWKEGKGQEIHVLLKFLISLNWCS